jgi:hypothetical protein
VGRVEAEEINTKSHSGVVLDNIGYSMRSLGCLPSCYTTVPISVKLDDEIYFELSHMTVGLLAKNIHKGVPSGFQRALKDNNNLYHDILTNGDDHSTLEPVPAWFLYRTSSKGTLADIESYGKERIDNECKGCIHQLKYIRCCKVRKLADIIVRNNI